VLFGLLHIRGFGLWAWVDVISVMILAIAFTYTAYKTRTLVAAIVFHFLHDTFLFLPQVPGGGSIGVFENITFSALPKRITTQLSLKQFPLPLDSFRT